MRNNEGAAPHNFETNTFIAHQNWDDIRWNTMKLARGIQNLGRNNQTPSAAR